MKSLIYILFLFCTVAGYAAKSQEKQIRKILKTNPYLYVPAENADSRVFWEYIRYKNKALTQYEKTQGPLKRKVVKKLQKYAFCELTFIPSQDIYFHLENACPNLRTLLCGTQERQFFTIVVTRYPLFNAYTTPHGYILLSADLFEWLDESELTGILAHEMAHFMLKHSEIHEYKSRRQKRRNNIIAGITSAMVAAANMYADITYAEAGVQTDYSASEYTAGTVENLFEGARQDALTYYFKYARSQEIEADIIAMRFLEFQNLDPRAYISALEKMKAYLIKHGYDTSRTDDTDDHPSLDFRIALLRALPKADRIHFQLPQKQETELPDKTIDEFLY